MHPPVALSVQRVEAVLEVEVVREHPARLEVRAHEPVRALEQPLRLRVARPRGSPSRPRAARRTRRTRRSGGRQRRSRPPGPRPASPAAPRAAPDSAPSPHRMSGASLLNISVPAIARDQHTSHGHHPATTRLPVPDRDRARAAPTDRTAPARPADRSSAGTSAAPGTAAGPRGRSHRRSTSRPDSRARSPSPAAAATGSVGSASELLADPVLERIELRPRRLPLIPRRLRRRQRPRDRVAMQPRPPADLPARQPLDPVHPPDLRPLLHADHTPSSSPIARSNEGPDPAGRTDPAPGGPLFNRRRWPSFQSAPTCHELDE